MKEEIHPKMFRHKPLTYISAVILIPLGIGIIVLVGWWLVVKNRKLTITSDKINYETGVFSKTRSEIDIANIRNIYIHQGFINRIFYVGRIGIATAGHGHTEIDLGGIADPELVKARINGAKAELEEGRSPATRV